MDVHCTLLNLRDVSLLGDSLSCASVPSFCTICVTKHLPVCATNKVQVLYSDNLVVFSLKQPLVAHTNVEMFDDTNGTEARYTGTC